METNGVNLTGAAYSVNQTASGKTSGVDLGVNDFFKLIAAQLQNQSMYDTVDNTQFVAQLAQFTTLSQITELTSAMNSNLAVSMLGKSVCVTTTDDLGRSQTTIGEVEQISYNEGVPYLYVNGGYHKLSEITDIGIKPADVTGDNSSTETEAI